MVTSLTPFSFARLGLMECSRCAWALVYRSPLTTPVLFLWRKPVGSLKFPGNPFHAFALLSDPGRFSAPSPLAALRFCPAVRTTTAPTLIIISRLNHTALAPAPYASSRHRCRLRNVRFRLVASLCQVGFFSH